ncbi:MAG: N,N-dimethylformamidase beta subunit family domain-containing protein [Actinomycetota bacterium]
MSSTLLGSEPDPGTGPKTLTGYCEPWSLRAGEPIRLLASSSRPGQAELSLVRIRCGDPTRSGPGFLEEVVPSDDLPSAVELDDQPLRPGSFGTVGLAGLTLERRLVLDLWLCPTRPGDESTVASVTGDSFVFQLMLVDGVLRARAGGADLPLRSVPLTNRRWYHVRAEIDVPGRTVQGVVTTAPSASPGRDVIEVDDGWVRAGGDALPSPLGQLLLAAAPPSDGGAPRGSFDGRLARPSLTIDDTELTWDLAREQGGPLMVEVGGSERHGRLHQLPARAVTGPGWDGSVQRWTDDPSQWDAVHFHTDDLYDAGWSTTAELTLPGDLPSGIYAFRLQAAGKDGDGEIDRIPFFVRPAAGGRTADVALLASTATYLAYANHRMLFEGADFIATRNRLRPEHEYVRTNPEVGPSMYERHRDGSGVMFSSRRRPVLNLRPGADGWNFTPDTDLSAFLDHVLGGGPNGELGGHDVIADEDVHHDGLAALAPYRVIVTCTHPEYWSTAMLDALYAWQRQGGRLLYLGGNGFYWRVAFSDDWPGAMELRRAEDGVRNWETGPGESYHAFGGEYGGMWRRLGRAPNELVGIGFAAQGFERAIHYDVHPEAFGERTAWMWEGVELVDERLGTSGLGGGAAGQEIDRYDVHLGSPGHAVVVASATDFGADMVRTKEEFGGSVIYQRPDPMVRADIVFYETPGGGAVFSVGSISWFGALARNGYANDVAQLTANVVRRFADPTPFEPPRT